MAPNVVSIGILFNALVSGFVGAVALALVVFLYQRWTHLDLAMRAYTWFWWFTVLVWLPSALRYLLIGFGHTGTFVQATDVIIQTAIFLTGPTLFYYLSLRVFQSKRLADATCLASFILGLGAVWFVLQPDGIPIRDVTYFSADATINPASFAIFSFEAGLILALLLYDTAAEIQRWRRDRNPVTLYRALYSAAIIVYLGLGSIDESKIITDWPLVAFRLLYSGAFLLVYLVIIQHEAAEETYLIAEPRSATFYG